MNMKRNNARNVNEHMHAGLYTKEAVNREVATAPMFTVKTRNLLAVAGAVWLLAGANILRLGLVAYGSTAWDIASLIALLVGTVAVFCAFHLLIFNRMVSEHATRIKGYRAARTIVLKFFDVKGYVAMAAMMTFGIALRSSGLVPVWFIAFFYTGVGLALTVAGVSFLGRRLLTRRSSAGMPCPFAPSTWSHR